MGAVVGLGVLLLVGWLAPWRVTIAVFAVCVVVVLVLSHGHLTHW